MLGSPSKLLLRLSQAGVKRAASVFRSVGVGSIHPQWQARVDLCATCPLLVVSDRKTFCGRPLLRQIQRDEATEGCGCPIMLKAKDPTEHCPRDRVYMPATQTDADTCTCTWCTGLRAKDATGR